MPKSRPFSGIFFSFVILLLASCGGDPGSNSDPNNSAASPSSINSFGQAGCYAASYGEASNYGSISNTFGNYYYDQKMSEEIGVQTDFWGNIPATVYVLHEQAPQYKNAYAVRGQNVILFGYYMFYYTVSSYGEIAAAGILAHEWGHRIQYTFGWTGASPPTELEADAFSGYYMALKKQWAWSQIQGYYANVYATGDYYFNSPSHHGTPNQRLAAARLGVNTALTAIQNRQSYSYAQLHQIFSQQISTSILLTAQGLSGKVTSQSVSKSGIENDLSLDIKDIALGRSVGSEITYPNSTESDLMALYPRI